MLDEKLIAKHMATLNISREEAIQLIEDDKAIDRGAKMFELDPELEKGAKKARQGDRKPTVYKFDKRERHADTDKAKLVELLASAINMVVEEEPTITNAERQIDFEFNGRKFRVVLSAPRS